MRTSTEKAADGWEYTIIDDEPPSFWADAAKHGIHLVIGIRASDTDPDEEAPEHPEDDRQQVRASSFKDWNVGTSKHQTIGTRKRRKNMTDESEEYYKAIRNRDWEIQQMARDYTEAEARGADLNTERMQFCKAIVIMNEAMKLVEEAGWTYIYALMDYAPDGRGPDPIDAIEIFDKWDDINRKLRWRQIAIHRHMKFLEERDKARQSEQGQE